MDNLTHSLIGAALGQAGLKRKTGLAMPALIIGANLPDIDAGCVVYGVESLAMRRGITHGPIAMLVLPLVLAGALWWFDRWQARRGKRPDGRLPVHFGWLFALSLIGCLSHPLFDWFNNYGVRLLEPFSHRWFYGDTLFIIDPWILAILGAGVWFSLKRERAGRPGWTRPARWSLVGLAGFVAVNFAISGFAVEQMRARLNLRAHSNDLIVANAKPLTFWRREMLTKSGPFHGKAEFDLLSRLDEPARGITFPGGGTPNDGWIRDVYPDVDLVAARRHSPEARAFLFWSRMPVVVREGNAIILRDQRFMDPRTARQFSVTLRKPDTASHPE